jgi:AcrR family transcriptional regulator
MDFTLEQRKYAKGLAVRERIIDVACRKYAESGYGGCSVAHLAQAAAVSKNQLFHHFGSKEQVAVACVERVRSVLHNEIGAPMQIYPTGQQQLEFLLERSRAIRPYLKLLAVLAANIESLPAALKGELEGALAELEKLIRSTVKITRRSQDLAVDSKPRIVAGMVLAVLLGTAALESSLEKLPAADIPLLVNQLLLDSGHDENGVSG